MNYCVDCKYFGEDWDMQSDDRCIHPANKREKTKDPVSKFVGFRTENDGFTFQEYPLCDELRKSVSRECELFEPKEVDADI